MRRAGIKIIYQPMQKTLEDVFRDIMTQGMPDQLVLTNDPKIKNCVSYFKVEDGKYITAKQYRELMHKDLASFLGRPPTKKELNREWAEARKRRSQNGMINSDRVKGVVQLSGKRPIVIKAPARSAHHSQGAGSIA